LFTI
jgi:hypothetical protein